jgi:hypothetical protein
MDKSITSETRVTDTRSPGDELLRTASDNTDLLAPGSLAPKEKLNTLYDCVIDAYQDEYKDINENWRSIETKAQGAVAIAGIFAAGAFAFTRELMANASASQKWMHILTMVFLISSVVLSICSLFVRRTSAAPLGESMENLIRDILLSEIPEAELPVRLSNFQKQQSARWKTINQELTLANTRKGLLLLTAQCLLVLAIVTVGALTITIVLAPREATAIQEKNR